MQRKKRVTMGDVAKEAGVSRTTVSFILNQNRAVNISQATRDRVLAAAQRLNYTPDAAALNLVTGRTLTIGLVVRQTAAQMSADAFIGPFIWGATQAIEPQGYHLLIHASEPDAPPSAYSALVRTRKVDGLLITSPLIRDPEIQALHDEGTPIVIHGDSDLPGIPRVDVDNTQGASAAVQHLLDLGHRRIGHISNAPFSYTSSRDRLKGYQQALEAAGLPYDLDLVQVGAFTDASGWEPMCRLLDLADPPTAVFVGSDVVALGAIDAIHSRGLRIPEDISIVGFDDVMLGKYLRPPLTSVHLPAYELGQQAGEMIICIIRDETLPSRSVHLPTQLTIRSSTAPPCSLTS